MKIALDDIITSLRNDVDSALVDDFYSKIKYKEPTEELGVLNIVDKDGIIDTEDAGFQLFIRDFLEEHENDYQIEDLIRVLLPYYDDSYTITEVKEIEPTNNGLDKKVKEYYLKEFPNEEDFVKYTPKNITFRELYDRMQKGEDVYDILDIGDSVVRERIFDELSRLLDVDYDVIYKLWLNQDDIKKSNKIKSESKSNWDSDGIFINGWHLEEETTNGGVIRYWLYNPKGLGGSLIIYPDTLEEFEDYLAKNQQVIGFEGNYLPDTIYNKIIKLVRNGTIKLSNKKEENKSSKTEAKKSVSISDNEIKKLIAKYLKDNNGIFTDDSKYDIIEKITGISNIAKMPKDIVERVNKVVNKVFNVSKFENSSTEIEDEDEYYELEEAKEIKTEGNYKVDSFSGIEFEKNIPYEMRFKEYSIVEDDTTLYWITQEFFGKKDLEEFSKAFKDTEFEKACVTVRDLSTYNYNKDMAGKLLVVLDKEGNIYSKDYEEAIKPYNYDFENNKWDF